MAQKAEIQYISQYYDYGDDEAKARKKKQEQEKKKAQREKKVKIHTFTIDPVALCGIFSAIVLCAALVFGGMHLNTMWHDHVAMRDYLTQLKSDNKKLQVQFKDSYNLDDLKTMADSIGLKPEDEMETRYIRVTPPAPKPKKGPLDNVKWFLEGLFAEELPPDAVNTSEEPEKKK